MQAYAIESQVVDFLLSAMSSKKLTDKLTSVESLLQQSDDRLQRAKILFLAGDIDKDTYDAEKERCEVARESLPFRDPGAIIASIHNTRQQLDEWNDLQDIKKKRLVRLVLERAYVQGEAILALQPSFAFAPLLNPDVLGCNCGPDGVDTTRSKNRGTEPTQFTKTRITLRNILDRLSDHRHIYAKR